PPPPSPPLPPGGPPPPSPLPPGEQLGTLNVSVTERFITTTLEIDSQAIEDRLQDYTNTLTAIFGAQLVGQATITVTAGTKVFTNTSTLLSRMRRHLQTVILPQTAELGYQTGVDCEDGYTPVTTTITLRTPMPQSTVQEVLSALPDNVINQENASVYLCGRSVAVFDESGVVRIAAPPPPPRSTEGDVLWPLLWAVLAIVGAAALCCCIYGIVVAEYDEDEEDRYDEYGAERPPEKRPPPPARRRRRRLGFLSNKSRAQVVFSHLGGDALLDK
ncbi:MAG: hypothetical protein ACKVI4_15355, partial [Actinomycetales bacterium]